MQKHKKEVAPAVADTASPDTDDRARLRHIAGELAKVQAVSADIDASQDRLVKVIRDADAADAALQEAVTEDGGVSLAEYSAGNAADAPIAKLITAKEITAKAAAVAKTALPGVQSRLDAARAEIDKLKQEQFDATIVYLKTRARDKNKAYHDTFYALSNLYDQLCAIAVATSVTGHAEMMTTGLPVAIQAPGFNMSTGPSHGPSEKVTLTHTPDDGEAKVVEVTSRWMQARERLLQDAYADLDDLIGPQVEKEN
jgi:hypothetical protein